MTPQELVNSLRSERCPACPRKKKVRMSFCGACYFRLPGYIRRNTYSKLGEGYEEAMASAIDFLMNSQSGADAAALAQFDEKAAPGLFGGDS